jgi:hypothetical protein
MLTGENDMMKQKILIFVALFLLVPGITFAQLKTQNSRDVHFPSALTKGYGQSSGLFGFLGLDASKIKMTHSYTLSFMTFGGQGFGQGVYLNTINYRFSTPLSMSVQWGMRHQPFESAGVNSPFKSGFFVSGASLDYKPSNNFHLGIQYSSYPTTGYYRSPFGYGYRPDSLTKASEENQ